VNSLPFRVLVLASALALAAGCANQQEAAQKPQMRALGQAMTTDAQQISDEAIGLEIRRRLELADAGDAATLLVTVDGGRVTLHGRASSLTAAWRAEGVARAVAGVREVTNQITVNP